MMPPRKGMGDLTQNLSSLPRPHFVARNSSSMPSTPYQHNRQLSFGARSPSPEKRLRDGSPKPSKSPAEINHRTRPKAPSIPGGAGCRFETGLAFSRRRIPYSIGDQQLERAKTVPKKFLTPAEEERLTGDIRALYNRILPSAESDRRRAEFVKKLDRILNSKWPEGQIQVHMFGSSGNMLCTNESDVDICITTPLRSLEKVCSLAAALSEHGMQRLVCIPHAKVPIVKFWDPELELACDMNVNNTLALENTRMIRTYVDIDERVRPLAMIVKQWTKKRILNDAALGGTLSSYAWISMILNFLQTRNPPILPSLHKNMERRDPVSEGGYAKFDDDLSKLRGYGSKNKETLGELLFHFFRRYAHDLDYERNVISVREGRLISKEAKRWNLMQNNRLCIEEPFNTERNLGNTADDTSFRGIHLELRRAFDLIAEAKLDQCLEQYEFPSAEEKAPEKAAAKTSSAGMRSRSQSQSSRGKGGSGNRGNRHHSSGHPKARRASSAASTSKYSQPLNGPTPYENPVLTADPNWQPFDPLSFQVQLLEEMQELQKEEAQLRVQQVQSKLHADMEMRRHLGSPNLARDASARFVSMSTPLRGGTNFSPYTYSPAGGPSQHVQTQPSSPSLRPAVPDLRRSINRPTPNDGSSSASVRSHSQPARAIPIAATQASVPPLPMTQQQLLQYQAARQQQLSQASVQQPLTLDKFYHVLESQGYYRPVELGYQDPRRHSVQPPVEEQIPKEYAGYWINDPKAQQVYREYQRVPLPQYVDPYAHLRNFPLLYGRVPDDSRSPSPVPALKHRSRALSTQSASAGLSRQNQVDAAQGVRNASKTQGPVIVNGTDAYQAPECPPMAESSSHTTISEATSGSEEHAYETPITGEIEPSFSGPFDENFAFDQARHLYQGGPFTDRTRQPILDYRSFMEPAVRRVVTQMPETILPNGGQKQAVPSGLNIQFGEVESSSRPVDVDETDEFGLRQQHPAPAAEPEPLSKATNGHVEKPAGLAPLLSPVREVRTPSPLGVRKPKPAMKPLPVSVGPVNEKIRLQGSLHIPSYADLVRARADKEKRQQTAYEQADPGTPNAVNSKGAPKAAPASVVSPTSPRSSVSNGPVAVEPPRAPATNGWQQQSSKKHRKNRSKTGNEMGETAMPAAVGERKGG